MVYSEIIKHIDGRISLLQQEVSECHRKEDFDKMMPKVQELKKEIDEWCTVISKIPLYLQKVSVDDIVDQIDSQIEAELNQYNFTQKKLTEEIKKSIDEGKIKTKLITRGIRKDVVKDEFGEQKEVLSGGRELITLSVMVKKTLESRGKVHTVSDFHRVTMAKNDYDNMIYGAKIPQEIYEVDKSIILNLVKLVNPE
jgi:transcriptional regulator of heat shock response